MKIFSRGGKTMKRALVICLTIVLVMCLSVVSLSTQQATANPGEIYVPGDFPTIQQAINAAAYGDTVHVAAGIYYENITLKSGVIVQGAGPAVTIIYGNGSATVVYAGNVDSAAKLDGFTITNGYAYSGGGIYLYTSDPIISNNVIAGNSATAHGGGIYARYSSPTICNNIITDNSADIYTGGGICAWYSSPNISDNIIADNRAPNYGGGICTLYSTSAISNNIVTGNSADWLGGGIVIVNSSSATIINNTVSANSGSWGGGIAAMGDCSTTIINNIVTGNIGHGGICAYYNSSLSIDYNDVWNNSHSDYYGCSAGPSDIFENPLFINPSAGDYHLQPDSPCIDSGWNDAPCLPATDYEGDPRIVDGDNDGEAVVDMGADEGMVSAIDAIHELISAIEDFNLHHGIEYSLITKLENAIYSLDRGQENAAINKLNAFINHVKAQRNKKITYEQADEMIAEAQSIIDNI
jgi:hypothetical protein